LENALALPKKQFSQEKNLSGKKTKFMKEILMNSVFFALEILGTVAFALSGALVAMRKEMDIFGTCVLGMTTAVGGGVIRDLLIGQTPPRALTDPTHALIALAVSAFAFLPFMQKFFALRHRRVYDAVMLAADSLGLGIFTVIGASAATHAIETPNAFTVIFLGVITGVGGGVLRDLMAQNTPKIFVKHFYACASASGAVVYVLIRLFADEFAAFILGILAVLLLRILAAVFHWELPKAKIYHDSVT
jgi:uncharacterized membrane protein YeiH